MIYYAHKRATNTILHKSLIDYALRKEYDTYKFIESILHIFTFIIIASLLILILLGNSVEQGYSTNITTTTISSLSTRQEFSDLDSICLSGCISEYNLSDLEDIRDNNNNNSEGYSNKSISQPSNAYYPENHTSSLSNNVKTVNPEFSSFGPYVYAVWEQGSYGKSHVVLRRSNDSGASFSPAFNITSPDNTTDYSVHPDIAASGSNVYVIWQDSGSVLRLRMSNDSGASFSPAFNITSPDNTTDYSVHPDIAASGSNVYVVWKDSNSGIFFKKSDDGGVTFGNGSIRLDEERLPDGSKVRQGTISDLHLSASGSNVYVVWKDSNSGIFFKKSDDGGVTFGNESRKLNQGNPGKLVATPRISSFGSYVHVVWEQGSYDKSYIVLRRSNDGGVSFSPVITVSQFPSDKFDVSYGPEIATFGNITLIGMRSIGFGIVLIASSDNGNNFQLPVLLSSSTTASDLRLTLSEGGAYVLWKNSTLVSNNIYIKKGDDNSYSFDLRNATLLTNGTDQPLSGPAISSFGPYVYAVWEQGSYGKSHVVLRRSNDSGASFSPAFNITSPDNTTDYSVHPDIAASGSNVYVVWKDSNSGIFFKKSDDGGVTFGNGSIRLDEERLPDGSKVRQGTISDLHLSASGSNVYVVWKDSNSGIFFKKSDDGGVSYGPLNILSDSKEVSQVAILPSGNSNVHVVWQDTVTGNYSIYYKRSIDGGRTFDTVTRLNGPNGDSYEPDLAVENNNVVIVWKSANAGIFARVSTNNGANFSPPLLLSDASDVADLKVSTTNDKIYIVWKSNSIILRTCTIGIGGLTIDEQGIDIASFPNTETGTVMNLFGANQVELSSAQKQQLYLVWSQPEISLRDETRSAYSDIFYARVLLSPS